MSQKTNCEKSILQNAVEQGVGILVTAIVTGALTKVSKKARDIIKRKK